MKYIFIFAFFICQYCHCEITMTCNYSNSPLQFNASQITVQRDQLMDTPIGEEMTVDETGSDCSITSTAPDYLAGTIAVTASQVDSGKKINGRTIFLTNISGIGYALGINNQSWNNKLRWVGDGYDTSSASTHSSGTGSSVPTTQQPIYSPSTVHIQLYKIGDIASGVVTGNIGSLAGALSPGNQLTGFATTSVPVIIGTIPINVVKCQLDSTAMVFPIGEVTIDQFTAIGSSPHKTATVNLGLDCDVDANINITLTGILNPDTPNDKSVLGLSSQGEHGVADGVGVQLLYNDTPLEVDNMLNLKRSAGGQESFPITARYIQTKDKVMPGKADATAILNLIYQ